MNEINFNIEDTEKINLSLDVGIKEIYPPIEDLEVTPTTEEQIFTHENSYGYDKITVKPIPEIKLQDKEATPTKETQNIVADENYDGLNQVTINPIPDEYIIPEGMLPITENTTYDVTRYARVSANIHPAPNLQDKSITITENGTQNITCDEGYDGLGNVEVTTNIEGASIPTEYIQDGLIAWFDARDDFEEDINTVAGDPAIRSRVGEDLLFQLYPRTATSKSHMKELKTKDAFIFDTVYNLVNNANYCIQDYTIELVGLAPTTTNTNFLCFDRNQTTHININRYGEGIFSPQYFSNGQNYLEKTIDGLVNKRCTMAINLKKTFPRGTSSGVVEVWYSVNGSQWYVWDRQTLTSASSYKSTRCVLGAYYSDSMSTGAYCEINCIRVYNRRLSDSELIHNHEVDKQNFEIASYTSTSYDFTNVEKENVSLLTSGVTNSYAGWYLYKNIDVSNVNRIEYSNVPVYSKSSTILYGIIFYDSNNQFISGISKNNCANSTLITGSSGYDYYISGYISVPDNAKYMRVAGGEILANIQIPSINLIVKNNE